MDKWTLTTLKTLGIDELERLRRFYQTRCERIQRLLDRKFDVLTHINNEIISRDQMYSLNAQRDMLDELEKSKDRLTESSYGSLRHQINDCLVRLCNNRYLEILTIDATNNIKNKVSFLIKDVNPKARRFNQGYGPKHYIVFTLNHKERTVNRKIVSSLLTTGKDRFYYFTIDDREVKSIARMINKRIKPRYENYREAIRDVISLFEFIDNDFENYLLPYHLNLSETKG